MLTLLDEICVICFWLFVFSPLIALVVYIYDSLPCVKRRREFEQEFHTGWNGEP